MSKILLTLAALAGFLFFASISRAEVYGYVLTGQIRDNGMKIENGATVDMAKLKSSAISTFFEVKDPADPNAKPDVTEWIISYQIKDDNSNKKEGVLTDNTSKTKNSLSQIFSIISAENIDKHYIVITAKAKISTHLTNQVVLKFYINDPKELASPVTPEVTTEKAILPKEPTKFENQVVNQITKSVNNVSNTIKDQFFAVTDLPKESADVALATAGATFSAISALAFSFGSLSLYRRRNYWGKIVSNLKNIPIEGAAVILRRQVSDYFVEVEKVKSDKDGYFNFNLPSPGLYKIDVEKKGFSAASGKQYFNTAKPFEVKDKPPKIGLISQEKDKDTLVKSHINWNSYIVSLSILILLVGAFITIDNVLTNPGQRTNLIAGIYLLILIFDFWALRKFTKPRYIS